MKFNGEGFEEGLFVGRLWLESVAGPALVTVRDGHLVDITSRAAPTMRDLLEMDNPVAFVRSQPGKIVDGLPDDLELLSPFDLQAIKACGVTFARSMIERVIEERAGGDPVTAGELRTRIQHMIGDSLASIEAGSEAAALLKSALIREGMWSQYLEVGIGPDAEVFTKAQPLSSVGHGADVGLHPGSRWNNPEPEIVLAVNSRRHIQGATLGNDVNLRDFEGRSALLLGKAKDNNASCSIGPFIRLFDDSFGLDDIKGCDVELRIEGEADGFVLSATSAMSQISRDPEDLVRQTIGAHHQYPDGLALFLGTMFAPIQDRDAPGEGFTHKLCDRVTISSEKLGRLTNTVQLSTECTPWTLGSAELMRNLSRRGLL